MQAASAAVFHRSVMWVLEDPAINFTLNFALAMGWQIIAVSFGAFIVLMYLINRNSESQTSALFFLVPPVAALMGFILRDERLTAIDMFGFALASFGVYLATRKTRKLTAWAQRINEVTRCTN